MSLVSAVTWLALRELWISFRLIVVIALFLLAGALVALQPGVGLQEPAGWYAIGLAVASIAAGVMTADTLAGERRRGTAAWLASRAVPRVTLLVGWFLALLAAGMVGLVPGAALAWLSILPAVPSLDPSRFAIVVLAVGSGAQAALALGMLAGALVPPRRAALLTLSLCAMVAAGALAMPAARSLTPTSGYFLLAEISTEWPLGHALQAIGIGLASAAILLGAAGLALERADL
ncbi:MAG: ABC transporter permease subunit [Chloroflexota bacterium]|nr:ABC transporter permease subunit [Chloroflexota bacterium]